MTLSALLGSGGTFNAVYAGDRTTLQAIIMDLYATLRDREVCPHPDRPLWAECCNPTKLNCRECLELYAPQCVDCCACGASTPQRPGGRLDNDLILASAGGITVCGSFCRRCARVVRELNPGTRSARGG